MKRLILRRHHLWLLICGIALLAAAAIGLREWLMPSVSVGLAPHQALYDVSLSKLRQSNNVAAVHGQMFYRVDDACDGWNISQKFNLIFVYTEVPAAMITSDYNTYESKDGRKFQFSTRRLRDGELTEEILGRAERKDPVGNGTITFQKPKAMEMPMAAEVLFPAQHTHALLQAAVSGQKWFRRPLFDGSDGSDRTDVSGFIARGAKGQVAKIEEIVPLPIMADPATTPVLPDSPKTPVVQQDDGSPKPMTAEAMNASPLVAGTRAWRIRLAFYPAPVAATEDESADPEAEEAAADDDTPHLTPDYEMTMVLHSNGLVSSFTLDYPDFSLDARLLSIAEIAKNGC